MAESNGTRPGNRDGRKAILAVALASGRTLKQAAAAAGVSERTASKWHTDPQFKGRVLALRGEVVSRALGRVTASLTAAANTLRKLLESGNDAIRLGAAKSIIDAALRLREANDLQQQLDDLRALVEPASPDPGVPPFAGDTDGPSHNGFLTGGAGRP
jgi:hypothetical protein